MFKLHVLLLLADIYGCTRALQNALKHPLVLTDSDHRAVKRSPKQLTNGDYLKRVCLYVSLLSPLSLTAWRDVQ